MKEDVTDSLTEHELAFSLEHGVKRSGQERAFRDLVASNLQTNYSPVAPLSDYVVVVLKD